MKIILMKSVADLVKIFSNLDKQGNGLSNEIVLKSQLPNVNKQMNSLDLNIIIHLIRLMKLVYQNYDRDSDHLWAVENFSVKQ